MGINRPEGPYAVEMTAGAAWPAADEDAYRRRSEELTGTHTQVSGAREQWESHRHAVFGGDAVWSGRAADAAVTEVDSRTTAMGTLETQLRSAVGQARAAAAAITDAKTQVADNVRTAQQVIAGAETLDADGIDAFINQVVVATYAANTEVVATAAARLTGPATTKNDLPDSPMKAFGPKQDKPSDTKDEKTEGGSIADGNPSPAELEKLRRYTTLDKSQLDALKRGESVTVPQEQMDYLNNVMRSLDGKSPAEIQKISGQLGPDGGRLADAMQLVSNPHIKTANAQGSLDNLPSKMREALTSDPLKWHYNKGSGSQPEINRDLNRIAGIVAQGNPDLQQGTILDSALLRQSQSVLEATTGEHHPEVIRTIKNGPINASLQNMLSASGRDQIAVHDALIAATPESDKFIGNLFTHQWSDGGAAAGTLLNTTGSVPTDLADPTQAMQATRTGQTMHAVDQWVGQHAQDLLNIEGADNRSLGQVNPELTKALAEANRPYIDDMLSNPLDNSRGFGTLDDVKNSQMPVTRDLFAVIDTNKDAAQILNTQAYVDGLQYQSNFERSIIEGAQVNSGDLQSAGTLRGVIDSAANIADNDAIDYGNGQALEAWESRGQWFDAAEKAGGHIPYVKDALDVVGDPLRDAFVGDEPVGATAELITTTSSEAMQYSIAQQLLSNNIGDSSAFGDLLDPATGQLRPLDENLADFRSAFNTYFTGVDPAVKSGIEDYEDSLRDSLPVPPAEAGK